MIDNAQRRELEGIIPLLSDREYDAFLILLRALASAQASPAPRQGREAGS